MAKIKEVCESFGYDIFLEKKYEGKNGYSYKSEVLGILNGLGFLESDYNKTIKLYPKKEIRVKTFQIRNGYSIVINDIFRIDNLGKGNSFSFYMSDKLRYEKVKFKNEKLMILPSVSIETNECTDVLVNGLGFIRITKPGKFKIYTLDEKMISIRKSMI